MKPSLSHALRARGLVASPALDALLERLVERARTAWPRLLGAPEAFLGYALARLPADGDAMRALAALHAEDLCLAHACSLGDPAAMAELEKRFISQVAAYVARTDASPAVADEVRQILRERLLVPKGGAPPGIASYTGRGALGGWLRISAVRLVRDLQRAERGHLPLDRAERAAARAPADDPEMDYLKARYAKEFRTAFSSVLARLPDRERAILCLYFLDGVKTDAIGRMYKVDGSTVRRWLQDIRDRIFEETRQLLAGKLRVGATELESLMGLVRSRIDVSISRHLRAARPAPSATRGTRR